MKPQESLKGASIISELREDMARLQGHSILYSNTLDQKLGPISAAFPNGSFPIGAVHEFLSSTVEDIAATWGFTAGLLSSLLGSTGVTLWISASRRLFPPALRNFGLNPDRFIFVDLKKDKDVLWAMDEALRCSALTTVVAEMREISFSRSQRLQLAVEQSKVTAFLLRSNYRSLGTTACVSRWNITSLPNHKIENMPGIGHPKWRVELSRVRNGKPGIWDIAWMNGQFVPVHSSESYSLENLQDQQLKAG